MTSGTLWRTRVQKRIRQQELYLALRLLVLAGAVAEAGKDGGDGLGVVEAARKDDLVAVVLLARSLPSETDSALVHGDPTERKRQPSSRTNQG